ncbi:MAG: tRNA (guanosine(37)-N1)-methyltransferase TrmD [Anaerofustis stercorihominis]|nr:tRNA (guanosine(37)-N1)-methyltransferase TrmD [Anaerofustis stercorihominis]
MIFNVLTLYDELINEYAKTGVIGRAVQDGTLSINAVNIRDYAKNKHKNVDDYPYGGGAGMVMMPQPVCDCVEAVKGDKNTKVVFFTPRGRVFDSSVAKEYAKYDELILLCGHFEGIDERAIKLCVDDEISMGDYIITGGHIAAMCFMDSVSRYVDGVLGNDESSEEESFENGLLEYEQYTRPYEFRGMTVPDVLLSGHHKNISAYKKERSVFVTEKYRPDLIRRDENKNE